MYLSRFGVKNYKCLGEIDIPLTPIHVLIGENDAGKTSLLEAMAAFFASSKQHLPKIFPEPWQGRELVWHGSSGTRIDFRGEWAANNQDQLSVEHPQLAYAFSVDFAPSAKACKCYSERIELAGETVPSLGRDGSDHTCIQSWQPHAEAQGPRRAGLEAVSEVLRPAQKYAFNPKVMALPVSHDRQQRSKLDPDGFGLSTLLAEVLHRDVDQFVSLRNEFRAYFPQFENVSIEEEPAFRRDYTDRGIQTAYGAMGKAIYLATKGGERIRAQQTSDGAILFMAFLALAHLPDPPNLLLIEEPENGIYPKRLGEVIKLLKELVNRTEGVRFPQIVMSTHSPYVLSFFEPEEVTFLGRPPDDPDGPVRARPLRDAPNIEERMADGFYLGELWYNLSEEELFGDA